MKFSFNSFFQLSINNQYFVSDVKKLDIIKKTNRQALGNVTNWIDEKCMQMSYYKYGVPDSIKNLINLEIGDEITYTDLLSYYSKELSEVNYLELGVSVGKNFIQLATQFENSKLTGFDIENINKPLEDNFIFNTQTEWPTMKGSLRTENSSLSSYKFGSNTIDYLAGDIWDEVSWSKLKGEKFNIIFSDALHDPKALLWEYKMIKKYGLLAETFIYIWDDLNNGLEDSFKIITRDIKKERKLDNSKISLIKINGWLGENYHLKHDVGIITSIELK
jgi:hypothetical protein